MKVCSGHWATEECEVPGPVIVKVIREPGCWTCDSCTGRRCYIPGKVCRIREQSPHRKVCKKVWVPTVCEKEVVCIGWERETVVEKRCYKVCTMVPEQRFRTCSYQVCRMVPEQLVRTCSYKVCKMVREECSRAECDKV